MKAFLIGSGELSVRVLEELISQNHDVVGVCPDDHRETKVWHDLGSGSLRDSAKERRIPAYHHPTLNSPEAIRELAAMGIDVIFSVEGSDMLNGEILSVPKLGCFDIHGSYLPRHGGCLPLAWAIIEGDEFAGVTIHKAHAGTGGVHIVDRSRIPIKDGETGRSLYSKFVTEAHLLFARTLPKIASLDYTLTPMEGEGSHTCTGMAKGGYPFGGQINPYWDGDRKRRFAHALDFVPPAGHFDAPPKHLDGFEKPGVRVAIGFDCDRPRDSFVITEEGNGMAQRKMKSIEEISAELSRLGVPRTFFLCGHFLRSMHHVFGRRFVDSFRIGDDGVEIGDHSYSHNVVKPIPQRTEKIPLTLHEIEAEYGRNTVLFEEICGLSMPSRGFRPPLGHHRGISGSPELQDKFASLGIRYISSDTRGENDTRLAPLTVDGVPRQPYRYPNGLLEIPSIGWQDVVFSNPDRVSQFEELPGNLPQSYSEILDYYACLVSDAHKLAADHGRDMFLPLCMHPYDVSFYNKGNRFFGDLHGIVSDLGGSFCNYEAVRRHYDRPLDKSAGP